ncbi:MAG: MFS transporter [candidate division KSB1 bacterium]|nr:MFS transporter [candidate division KSB1 bacterium]
MTRKKNTLPAEEQKPPLLATISWILYDFANTAYSMNVVSLYFSTWIIIELGRRDIWVSLVNSLSMALVAVTLPVLGDWSDRRQSKLKALLIFTLGCIGGTFFMGVVGKGISDAGIVVPIVLILYVIANYSYQGGLVFYNALLPAVSTPKTLGRVSGYGVAIGYLGSAAGLLVGGLFVDGSLFGWKIAGMEPGGRAAAFIPTALLFLIFALPVFIFVQEPKTAEKLKKWTAADSYRQVWKSLKDTQKYPGLLRFLVAKFLYEDSIETIIIYMGVYTQAVIGFSSAESTNFFILLIPAAVIGSALCGILTDHFGPKKTLVGVIFGWVVCCSGVVLTAHRPMFWILGALIGALMGSTWTAARPLLITLAPKERLGEFFGLYALSGKAAAIIGPLIWSGAARLAEPSGQAVKYRVALASLTLIMFAGMIVLLGVPDLHRRMKLQKQTEETRA